MANEYFHSTTSQAATIAKEAAVKKLCLTHISSRYDARASEELLKQAQEVFPDTEIAHDFKSITISK